MPRTTKKGEGGPKLGARTRASARIKSATKQSLASERQAKVTEFYQTTRRPSPVGDMKKMALQIEETETTEICKPTSATASSRIEETPDHQNGSEIEIPDPQRERKRKVAFALPPPSSGTGSAKRRLPFCSRIEDGQTEMNEKKSLNFQPIEMKPLEVPPPAISPPTSPCKESVKIQKAIEPKESEPLTPSKLTAAQLKKRLGGVRNNIELREKLGKYVESIAKLNQQRNEAESPQKLVNAILQDSPVKKSEETAPASVRFASLATKHIDSAIQLPLPQSYKSLANIFQSAEQIVSIRQGRDQLIRFTELSSLVQKQTKETFEKKELAQIKTVYPEAYHVELKKDVHPFGQRARPDSWELIVNPNLDTDLIPYNVPSPTKRLIPEKSETTPTKVPKGIGSRSPMKTPDKASLPRQRLTAHRIICRRQIFNDNLLQIVRKEHRKFLEILDPTINLGHQMETKWHPEFAARLNQVAEIPLATLPEIPAHKTVSASEILKASLTLPEKVKASLENAARLNLGPSPKKSELSKVLQGVDSKVLKMVRARAAAKAKYNALETSEETQRRMRLARSERIVRIIKDFETLDKKRSFLMPELVEKIRTSKGSAESNGEIEAQIRLLTEVLPDWISLRAIKGRGIYVMTKKAELDQIVQRIHAEKEKMNAPFEQAASTSLA